LLVVAAVLVVAVIGGILIAVSKNKKDDPPALPTPTVTAEPTADPTTEAPEPPVSPEPQPTPEPTAEVTQPPAPQTSEPVPPAPQGTTLDLGYGITSTLPAAWEIADHSEGFYVLTGPEAILLLEAGVAEAGADPVALCQLVQQQLLADAANVQVGESMTLEVGTTALSAGGCRSTYTYTQGGATSNRYVATIVSIRLADSVTVLGSAVTTDATTEATSTEAGAIVSEAVMMQAWG
jgi:hypothetical protein